MTYSNFDHTVFTIAFHFQTGQHAADRFGVDGVARLLADADNLELAVLTATGCSLHEAMVAVDRATRQANERRFANRP